MRSTILAITVVLMFVAVFASGAVAPGQVGYNVLYSFGSNPSDGNLPNGGLVFDKAGNIYGTTQRGGTGPGCGPQSCGTVFQLTESPGGTWMEVLLYNFCSQPNCVDGAEPMDGLVVDDAGSLYGTTLGGGTVSTCGLPGCGTVFELSPPSVPGNNWTETVLWNFGAVANDGVEPLDRLNWDRTGNLFGTTEFGGSGGAGTVFELSPVQGGGWNETVLFEFCPDGGPGCPEGFAPMAGVSFDTNGNLYGTTFYGGAQWGVVYELSPPVAEGGGWTETGLYTFHSPGGGHPLSVVNLDQAGNLYTTVSEGARNSDGACGGVYKSTLEPGSRGKVRSYFVLPGRNGMQSGCWCIP